MVTRRIFVKYVGLGVLALALPPVSLELAESDDYISDRFGFRVRKPRDWRWVTAAEVDDSRMSARLPGGESAKKAAIRMAGIPILVATDQSKAERGPTLVVWRQQAHASHHSARDSVGFSAVHQSTYRLYQAYLRDYDLEAAGPSDFAGKPASRCAVRFGEDDESGVGWSVRLESNMLRWQDSWLTFNFLDLQDGWGRTARNAFAAIENSLEFFNVHTPTA